MCLPLVLLGDVFVDLGDLLLLSISTMLLSYIYKGTMASPVPYICIF